MCRDMGVGLIPYSPLARGLLAGTRERDGRSHTTRASDIRRPDRPADFDVQDAVRKVAAQRGAPAASIALAWLIGQPGVVAPIVGATGEHHLDDAVSALSIALNRDEQTALENPYLPRLRTDYT